MDGSHLARICRELGMPDLVDRIDERLAPTDVQTLLLEIARRRAAKRTPADLVAQYGRDRSVEPGGVDARSLARTAVAAYEAAPEFEAVDLSPVEPAGLNLVLGGIDQNNALATVRPTEVVADPTSALALEAVVRRRAGVAEVRLCACHRVLRMQPMDIAHRQHFTLFGLVTATRSRPHHGHETAALREHVAVHLGLLDGARRLGVEVDDVVIRVSDTGVHHTLAEWGVAAAADVERPADAVSPDVTARLGRRLDRLDAAVAGLADVTGARVMVDLTRTHAVGYYNGLQLTIAAAVDGTPLTLADGGAVDWAERLLSDRHERMFTSGIGLERIAPAR